MMKETSSSVLPIPPLQKLWLVVPVRGIVHRTSKNIKQAAVERSTLLDTSSQIQLLRILALEVGDLANSEFPEIVCNTLANAGDRSELSQ